MDTMEIEIGGSGSSDHASQDNSDHPSPRKCVLFRRTKTSGNPSEKTVSAAEEKQEVPTKLCVIKGPGKGQIFDAMEKTLFVGRSSRNDIQFKDTEVSRKHLKIFRIGKKLFVEDLMSTNGTLINGEMVTAGEAFEVKDGDIISIGHTAIGVGDISLHEVSDTNQSEVSACEDDQKEKYNVIKERRSGSTTRLEPDTLSELFDQSLNINGVLEKLLGYVFDTLPRIDTAAILTFDHQKGEIEEVISRSRSGNGTVRYNRRLLGRLAKDGKPIKISDTTYEMQADLSEELGTAQTSSTLYFPIIANSKIQGILYLNSLPGPYDGFRKEDLLLLNNLSGFIPVRNESSAASKTSEALPQTVEFSEITKSGT